MKNTYKKFYTTQVSGLFKGTALVAILRNWQITVYKYHTGPKDTHNKYQLTHFTEKNKHKPPSSEQPEAYLTSLYHPVRTLGGEKGRSNPIHFFNYNYTSNFQQNLPHNPLFSQLVHVQE